MRWGFLERRPWSAWSEVREIPRRRYEIWITCIVHGLQHRGPRGPRDPRDRTVHHHRHHRLPSLGGALDAHVLGRWSILARANNTHGVTCMG